MNSEFKIVRRRKPALNSVASGRHQFHACTTFSFSVQRAGSVTPRRIQASNSAGNPPNKNIARQPKWLPILKFASAASKNPT